VTANSSSSFDFNYQQNVCDPLSFQFNAIGTALTNSYWDFGDGNSMSGNLSPVHRFVSTGNYIVKYAGGIGTCSDTLRKTISVNFSLDSLIVTSDTTFVNGSGKQLRTLPSLSFCWSPATYLDDPKSPIPTTTTPQDIVYYFTAEVAGINLITNGSFTSGTTGFTSEYEFTANNVTEGQYFVGSNPPAWNSSLNICGDHTSVNGNMMMVNGAPTPNVNVWKQTITVTPNTNYAFSTWIQALWPPNPAQLQFSINGRDVGQLITAPLPTCTWTQFYTTWNSGSNTTAVISIVNKNTQVQGNDFALDDISFAPVFIKRDSVVIKVEKPLVKANADTVICAGRPVQLNAIGAQTYSWSPAAGLSNTGIVNPIASPSVFTEYIVTGTTNYGCVAKDTVKINIHTKPSFTLSADTVICKNSALQLFASGGTSYKWSPTATLNNALSPSPVASPVVDTKYYVDITDINTCVYRDSVQVGIRPDPLFTVTDPTAICRFDSTQLSATGGNVFSWQPAAGLSNPTIPNPKASPGITTDYSVTITETTCNEFRTLIARVNCKAVSNYQCNES
jgi:PKD repeat protein